MVLLKLKDGQIHQSKGSSYIQSSQLMSDKSTYADYEFP